MSEIGVGKEVLSFCNKCKLTLAHMIVAMKDSHTIQKVQCKTCNGTHSYKDPSQVKAKKATTSRVKKTTAPKSSVADIWLEAVNSSTAKSQPYSIRSCFAKGDIIDHPKFGPGVIERTIDSDKIEVIFRHDIKTLIHNK